MKEPESPAAPRDDAVPANPQKDIQLQTFKRTPEHSVPRRRGRRRLFFRWYGLPSPKEAAWHAFQVWKHLKSLAGFRP